MSEMSDLWEVSLEFECRACAISVMHFFRDRTSPRIIQPTNSSCNVGRTILICTILLFRQFFLIWKSLAKYHSWGEFWEGTDFASLHFFYMCSTNIHTYLKIQGTASKFKMHVQYCIHVLFINFPYIFASNINVYFLKNTQLITS